MEMLDFKNQKIMVGSTVRYVGTHTEGKVNKICKRNGFFWVGMESTELYYRADHVEVVEPKKVTYKQSISEIENIKDKVAKLKFYKVVVNTEISEHGDGPGYGGG